MTTAVWLKKYAGSLAGKTVAINGATGGLGNALCRHLAQLKAHLILCDRNAEKSHTLGTQLQQEFPTLTVDYISLDLADMTAVVRAADTLEKAAVDYLILNAGIYYVPRYTADSGYNNVFQVNFIAPYVLARRLLPSIRARGGRVIAVGSIAYAYSPSDPQDIDFSTRRASGKVYGNAKRYLMAALTAQANNGGIAITHPGITLTNITAHYPQWLFALIKHPMKLLFMSPRRASLSILQGLYTDCRQNEWIGPWLWRIWGLPKRSRFTNISAAEAARMTAVAQELYRPYSKNL